MVQHLIYGFSSNIRSWVSSYISGRSSVGLSPSLTLFHALLIFHCSFSLDKSIYSHYLIFNLVMRTPQSPAEGYTKETKIWNGKTWSLLFFFCKSPQCYLCVFLTAINFSPTLLLDPSFFLLWSEFCHYMLYCFLCLNYYFYAWLLSVFL